MQENILTGKNSFPDMQENIPMKNYACPAYRENVPATNIFVSCISGKRPDDRKNRFPRCGKTFRREKMRFFLPGRGIPFSVNDGTRTARSIALLLLCFLCTAVSLRASAFEERRDYILDYYSRTYPDKRYWGDHDIKTAMGFALARLETKTDVARALDMIDRMQDVPFDMFDCHGNIDAYFRFSSVYPETLKEKVKRQMTDYDYTVDGSTENHKLMFKTAGYLTALAFPDWENAAATMEHCRSELLTIMDETVRYGIKEYDSPTYGTFYITCLLSLYDHCRDAGFRNRVRMTLEWHLLNMAPEWMDGYFISSSLREYEFACSPRAQGPYPLVGWLFFGGGPDPVLEQTYVNGEPVINNEGFFSVLAALTSYRMPGIIGNVASDRSRDYVHKESHDMNPFSQLNYPWGIRKYTYMNRTYGLVSQWDGLSLGWSAQMRRWKLVWKSDAPASTFFLTHPCYYEGAAARLCGATPREQVLQHKGALLAVYKIESGEPHPYVTGVVPVDAIRQMKEDPSGWLFFDGVSVLFAVKFFHPYTWGEERTFRGITHKILRCDRRGTAVAIETCLPEAYPAVDGKTSLELFAVDVMKKTQLSYGTGNSGFREAVYKSLNGDTLKLIYNSGRFINGEKTDYDAWSLYSNPWMEQTVNGRFLNVSYGGKSRVYDFRNWTVTD
jgi:hypothetical protein